MPNANYLRGRRAEYRVIAILKESGFAATRAAGSKGMYDVIAWKEGFPRVRFIQVKKGRRVDKSVHRDIAADPMGAYGQKELWEFEEGSTKPIVTKFE